MPSLPSLYEAALQAAQSGQDDLAEQKFRAVLDQLPTHPGALNILAILLIRQKRFAAAEDFLKIALQHGPAPATFQNYGVVLLETHRISQALEQFEQVLAQNPTAVEAWFNKAVCLHRLKRYEDALIALDACLSLAADHLGGQDLRGRLLMDLGRYEEARRVYQDLTSAHPHWAEAYCGLGLVFSTLRHTDQALEAFHQALNLKPNLAEALFGRGLVLARLRRFDQALSDLDRAIALLPDAGDVHAVRGGVYAEMGRLPEAVGEWQTALQHDPKIKWLPGLILHTKMQLGDWSGFDVEMPLLIHAVRHGEPVSSPFYLLALSDARDVQRMGAQTWLHHSTKVPQRSFVQVQKSTTSKLKIGYFSADFHDHATMYLLGDVLSAHDREQFEISLFSWGPQQNDAHQMRARAAADHFVDVADLSDGEIAQYARDMQIDIAIDLKGYTKDARPGIFAHRPAPISINYLGYPGTMAADFMDYAIVDSHIAPSDHWHDFSEKLIVMPHCYQPNSAKLQSAGGDHHRSAHGLPQNGFVFCSFNNAYKITPDVFTIWMNILHSVPGSVLWLLQDHEALVKNLRHEAMVRGVAPERLIFAPRVPLSDHLARMVLADLFLDTFPCNAHTTASDALRAGVLLLTRKGQSFVSRVAASLLTCLDLPELITEGPEAYQALAVGLAQDKERLADLRARLARNQLTHPLFQPEPYTRHLERAYRQSWERHQAGLTPDHLILG